MDSLVPDHASPADEAICVIGIACRYPGEEDGVAGFWKTIVEARSTHAPIPHDRFNPDDYYHPSYDRAGAINTKGGYFLKEDISRFDAPFFSITAHEAAGMDPQQRMLLEVAYETFENAGVKVSQASGSKTSCYVGSFSQDYFDATCHDINDIHPYASTGTGKAMLSNRISWFFDLKGPSLTIDTACSSSMYALHLACQSLRMGESNMGLVGGSNIILAPSVMRVLASMRFLSPTGKCHSFDEAADGYARGEGVGMLLLKRLSDAIADGDTIRAVIRSSGVNQDGHTPGITIPSSSAQAALIQQCYAEAGISLDDTAYFEGHGTGTLQGDPLELQALGTTFGVSRTSENPLVVGSVKANIGHQEGGAGVAGVIRAVLAVEKGIMPPTAELVNPNKAFKLEEWNVALSNKALPWPHSGPRRVSVNSFGYGGANSHAIIEDAYHYMLERGLRGNHNTCLTSTFDEESDGDSGFESPSSTSSSDDGLDDHKPGKLLFTFSAFDQAAIGRMLTQYLTYFQERLDGCKQANGDLSSTMSDLAYTLAHRRSLFPYRAAFAAGSMTELAEQIRANPAPKSKKVPRKDNVAFVFTGQGAQHCQMGKSLFQHQVFSRSIDQSQAALAALGCEWDIVEKLLEDESSTQIHLPIFSQPLCTAVQIALVDLLASWQIVPKMAVGHSSGEIAAAYASGKLSQADAMAVAYHRGRFSSLVPTRQPTQRGAMLAVGLGPADVAKYVSQINAAKPGTPSVVVACLNSPNSVTLSGDSESIDALEAQFKDEQIFARMLKTCDTAYHSPHMECIADDYHASLKKLRPLPAMDSHVLLFSSLTAGIVPQFVEMDASYWVDNMLRPVQFSQAVHAMLNHSNGGRKRRRPGSEITAIVEIGPSSALKGPIQQILAAEDPAIAGNVLYTSLLKRGEDAESSTLDAVARLWERGTCIDIDAINQHLDGDHPPKVLVDLPAYKWNHSSRIWHEATVNQQHLEVPRTDLLGYLHSFRNMNAPIWRNMIRLSETPWLADHKVFNAVLYSGASMIVMALEAAVKQAERGRVVKGYQFRDIRVPKALVIPPDGRKVEVQMTVKAKKDGTRTQQSSWYEFSFVALDDQRQWNEHCFGQFKIIYETQASEVDDGLQATQQWTERKAVYDGMKSSLHRLIPKASFYRSVQRLGMHYGPTFQSVDHMYTGRGIYHGVIEISDTAKVMPHGFEHEHLIHPSTLDGMIQTLFAMSSYDNDYANAYVPVNIGKLYVAANLPSGAGNKFYGYGSALKKSDRETIGQIVMSDEDWSEPKVVFEDIVSMSVSQIMASQDQSKVMRRKCGNLRWVTDLRHASPTIRSDIRNSLQAASGDVSANINAIEMMRRTLDVLRNHELQPRYLHDVFCWAEDTLAQLPNDERPSEIPEALVGYPEGVRTLVSGEEGSYEALTQRALSFLVDSVSDPASFSALDEWLHEIYRNKPDASVLLLGDGSPVSAACHVARNHVVRPGRTDAFYNGVLTEVDQYFVDKTKEALEGAKAQLKYAAFNSSGTSGIAGVEAALFDVIVAPPGIAFTESALESVKKLLAPNGTLLFSGAKRLLTPFSFISSFSETWWAASSAFLTHDTLEINGGQLLRKLQSASLVKRADLIDDGHHVTLAVVPKQHAEWDLNRVLANRQFVLLQPTETFGGDVTRFQELLTRRLRLAGCTVLTTTFDDQEAIAGRTVISLVELFEDAIANLNEETLTALQNIAASASEVVWLTRNSVQIDDEKPTQLNLNQSLTTGLFRSIRAEISRITSVNLDLSSSTDITSTATVELVLRTLAHELFRIQQTSAGGTANHDRELAVHVDKVFVPRFEWDDSFNQELALAQKSEVLVQQPLYQLEHSLKYVVGIPGRLDSLHWIEHELSPSQRPLTGKEVWMKVTAWPLNFMDVMSAMGQIPTANLGLELAGEVLACGPDCTRIRPGMRVVTPAKPGFVSHHRADECPEMKEIPANMDMATAASLPMIYVTAYLALMQQARLRKGETILIHAAAGGVGQATLQMARWIGAEIYATVGSNAKRQLLIDHYGIPAERIFSSRDLTFGPGIMRATNGRGVDVIVNCLVGEALRETWNCIATFGRFVEIGKRDILANNTLEMSHFLRHTTFSSVNLELLEELDRKTFQEAWTRTWELVVDGTLGPVFPITKFHISDAEQAFRLVASGAHAGKVVVTADEVTESIPSDEYALPDDSNKEEPLVRVRPSKIKEVELDPSASYVLCGGLGGVGRTTALMMAQNGAKHLIFLTRSGATKHQQLSLLKDLDEAGVRTDVLICDATDATAVADFVTLCHESRWKVKGVVQCAMVLRDRMFENMTCEEWTAATSAKVQGTKNLSDALPADLDFFIMLSSISGVFGNPGQSNYNAANTYLDALARWRRAHGMTAVTIDLGVVADSGYLAETAGSMDAYASMAYLHITDPELRLLLSAGMKGHTADGRPLPPQILVGVGKEYLSLGTEKRDSKFAHLMSSNEAADAGDDDSGELRELVASCTSIRNAAHEIREAVVNRLSRALMIGAADIDASQPLHAYGVDSLIAIDIRNWVFRELAADITVFDIISPMPISILALKIASVSGLLPKNVVAAQIDEVSEELKAFMPVQ